MAKKYVVAGAWLKCQYGDMSSLLVPEDRHIEAGGMRMANETDCQKKCIGGRGFGICSSPYINLELTQAYHDFLMENRLKNIQQIRAYGTQVRCEFQPGPQWIDTKENVYIAKYRALMEDSWTFCQYGLGFITLINSGQNENPADQLMAQLNQLEAVVDSYVQEKRLSEKTKNDLLNSVILWNGYKSIPWETKMSQELWDFGIYMEQNYPSLSNYFEDGIYLYDAELDAYIDVSYMAGISVALNQSNRNIWELLNEDVISDPAVYHGYLEAGRQGGSDNAMDGMKKFLSYYNSPEYDGSRRIFEYLEMSPEDREIFERMNDYRCSMNGSYYEPGVPLEYYGDPKEIREKLENQRSLEELSQEEKDLLILQRGLQQYNSEELTNKFINQLYQSAGKEKPF